MASEPHESLSSLINRLISLPFVTPESESDSDHDSDPNMDRIVLINPFTQGMVVIRGSRAQASIESLLNDLMMKKEGQPPASQASIDAMASFEIKGEEEIESLGGECVICLEDWGVGDVAKEMPCKHRFHGRCVEKWLKIHGSCPVCRHKMPVEDGDKEGGDKSGNENEGRRRVRREIWVSFSFGNGSETER